MSALREIPVRVTGAELVAYVQGDGLPVCFVHGFPFDHALWRHQLAAPGRWRRIAFDLRGAGASTADAGGDWSMARYADDVVAVLDARDVREAVVCGQSMGGYILFELLRRHAERVRAVILCATRPDADPPEAKRARDELAAVAQRDGPDAVADRLLPRLLGAATRVTRPDVVAEVRGMIGRCSVEGMVGALRAMRDRPDSSATLRGLGVPALVVAGEQDAIAPPGVAEALVGLIPGAQLALVPRAGHVVPLEQPDVTNRVLSDFLGSCA